MVDVLKNLLLPTVLMSGNKMKTVKPLVNIYPHTLLGHDSSVTRVKQWKREEATDIRAR